MQNESVIAMPPKVFIIILNWNGYDVTKECLESLSRVDYANFEIVVVDNGSKDSSPERLMRGFPGLTVIRNESNLGFTGGNNVGIRCALEQNANYILLLNNDTVVAPAFLSELIRVAESDARIGILNPKIYYFEPPTMLWYAGGTFNFWRGFPSHIGHRKCDRAKYNQMRQVTFITGCAFLVKATVVREIGLLDEQLFYTAEDTDWSIRALQAGYTAVYVPSSMIWHKESFDTKRNAGKSFRDFYNIRNTLLLARKHAHFYHWPTVLLSLGLMLAYRAVGYSLRREFDRVRALFRGVRAGAGLGDMPPGNKSAQNVALREEHKERAR